MCNHSEKEIMQDLQKLSGKQSQQTGESPVTITAVPIHLLATKSIH